MYSTKDLIVVAGSNEIGDQIIDLRTTYQKTGWELVVYNKSSNASVVTVREIPVPIVGGMRIDEAFSPFESFEVSETGGGAWMWYIRGEA